MAAGNDGANKPENDDPFGYLYEDGQAAGAQPPGGGGYGYPGPAQAQPGVPRTSYNQVRTVGERQYGGQQYAQPHVPSQQQSPYGRRRRSTPPRRRTAVRRPARSRRSTTAAARAAAPTPRASSSARSRSSRSW